MTLKLYVLFILSYNNIICFIEAKEQAIIVPSFNSVKFVTPLSPNNSIFNKGLYLGYLSYIIINPSADELIKL